MEAKRAPQQPRPMPVRYVSVDPDGKMMGFFSSDIHKPNQLPATAVKITEAQYRQCNTYPHKKFKLINGTLVEYIPEKPMLTLSEKASAALEAGLTVNIDGDEKVFPVDHISQQKVAAVALVIYGTGKFPEGKKSYPMRDIKGGWTTFNLKQYGAIAGALAAYASSLHLIADGNPLKETELPPSSVKV